MGKMGMKLSEPTMLKRLRDSLSRGRRLMRAAHREFVLQRTLRRIRAHDDYIPLSDLAVENLLYGWGNEWSLREELITELWHRAWHTRGPVLECGSGLSTLAIAGYDSDHTRRARPGGRGELFRLDSRDEGPRPVGSRG